MKRLAAASLLATTALLVPVIPASAATPAVTIAPSTVVLKAGQTTSTVLTLKAGDGWCLQTSGENAAVVVAIEHTHVDAEVAPENVYAVALVAQKQNGDYYARLVLPDDKLRGQWDVFMFGQDCEGEEVEYFDPPLAKFRVRSQTSLLVDASPEPVAKGKTIAVLGTLRRLGTTGVAPFGSQQVAIEFRPKGETAFTRMAVATTNTKGVFKKSFPAVEDGTWRAHYLGATNYAASAKDDAVDVR